MANARDITNTIPKISSSALFSKAEINKRENIIEKESADASRISIDDDFEGLYKNIKKASIEIVKVGKDKNVN